MTKDCKEAKKWLNRSYHKSKQLASDKRMLEVLCVTCETFRAAYNEFDKFLKDNEICLETKLPIKKKCKRAPVPIIILDNGNEFHFVPKSYFETWCKGRMYTMLGTGRTYHSDLPCKIESSEVEKNGDD